MRKKKASACCANSSVEISFVSINSMLSIAEVLIFTHFSSINARVTKCRSTGMKTKCTKSL